MINLLNFQKNPEFHKNTNPLQNQTASDFNKTQGAMGSSLKRKQTGKKLSSKPHSQTQPRLSKITLQ